MNDMHVHTHFSCDSTELPEIYLQAACERGVKTICFTDHVDFNMHDSSFGFYNAEAYFSELKRLRGLCKDITILAGMEFGEPQLYADSFKKLCQLPYDCVMGSVHFCNFTPDLFFSELVTAGVSAAEAYAAYWVQVHRCVDFGGFEVLGHMDFPKRYYQTLLYDEGLLRQIFRIMLNNNIVPEINTSAFIRGYPCAMPDRELLALYAAEGGKYVTVGSDSHSAEFLGVYNDKAQALIDEFNLWEVIFVNRQMIIQ
jgi:histidinol-phosphatase (PHP family)